MVINANTRIATLLRHRTDALDALVSINSRFEKLKNPILYRLMAGRTSIAAAAKAAGCTVNDIFIKLRPLGFTVQEDPSAIAKETGGMPVVSENIPQQNMITLDVRPIIASGKDPLALIMKHAAELGPGMALKIINSFEPAPLMLLLDKQGFKSFSKTTGDDFVDTYFIRQQPVAEPEQHRAAPTAWDDTVVCFEGRTQTIDVRNLEMPLPMITILDALDKLPGNFALFVHHKRIPVFLLPELATRGFSYLVREINEGNVNLLIFRE